MDVLGKVCAMVPEVVIVVHYVKPLGSVGGDVVTGGGSGDFG